MKRIKTLFLLFAFVLAMCTGSFAAITGPITADTTLTGSESLSDVLQIQPAKTDIVIDGDGFTLTGGGFKVAPEKESKATVTIKNLTLTGATALYAIDTGLNFKGKLILDNVKIEKFASRAFRAVDGTVVIKDCTFTGDTGKFQQPVEILSADVTVTGDTKMGPTENSGIWDGAVFALTAATNEPYNKVKGTLRIESGDFNGQAIIVTAYNLSNSNLYNTGAIYITGGVFNGEENEDGLNTNLSLEPDFARRKVDVKIAGGKFSKEGTPKSADLKALLSDDTCSIIEEDDFWVVLSSADIGSSDVTSGDVTSGDVTSGDTTSGDQTVEVEAGEGESSTIDVEDLDTDLQDAINEIAGDAEVLGADDVEAVADADIPEDAKKSEKIFEAVDGAFKTTVTPIFFGAIKPSKAGIVIQKIEVPSDRTFTKLVFYFVKLALFGSSNTASTVSLAADGDKVEAKLLNADGTEATDYTGDVYAVPTEALEKDTEYAMVAGEEDTEAADDEKKDDEKKDDEKTDDQTTTDYSSYEEEDIADATDSEEDIAEDAITVESGYNLSVLGTFTASTTASVVEAKVNAETDSVYFVVLVDAAAAVATAGDVVDTTLLNKNKAIITTGTSTYAAGATTAGTKYAVVAEKKSGSVGSSGGGCNAGFAGLAALAMLALIKKSK